MSATAALCPCDSGLPIDADGTCVVCWFDQFRPPAIVELTVSETDDLPPDDGMICMRCSMPMLSTDPHCFWCSLGYREASHA